MPRSRTKPSTPSANSTKTTASGTDASQGSSDSTLKPSRKSAATSAGQQPPKHGSAWSREDRTRLLDELVAWIGEGKPLREWCRISGNPPWRTIYEWLEEDEETSARIARAREDGHDALAEQCQVLSDTPPRDAVEVQWRKLQIETRLKLLAKWNPRKYGDRVGVDHAGGVSIVLKTNVPDAADGH